MGANVWPANAVSSSPTYQGRALRQTSVAPGLAGASAARPAGAFSGVRPGTSVTIITATTTTWTVTPFGGVIDAESSNVAGPYGYFFDTNQSGSLTAAAGSTRLDRLDVQVSDPAEDGTGAVAIAIIKTDGVAGSGVTAAAPARSHPLAVISVPSAGSPTVIWSATYSVGAGGVLPVLTFALLPAAAQLGQRAEVFADSTSINNTIYRWNGSAWLPVDVICSLRKSGNQALTASAAAVAWDVETSDPAGMHDNVTNNTRITAPIAGLYEVAVQIYDDNASSSVFGTVSGRLNGTTAVAGSGVRRIGEANSGTVLQSIFSVVMAAADYLEIMANNSSATGNVIGGATSLTSTTTVKRIGPA